MLTDRQSQLLDAIVREYIKTAEPVASLKLSGGLAFSVSPATIRNDMAAIEGEGYLAQPHTSAGRIPTEKGFRFYINRLEGVRGQKMESHEFSEIRPSKNDGDEYVRELARRIAELTEGAVLVGFNPHEVYYTGLSRLFAQPEFHGHAELVMLTATLDRLEEVMAEFFDDVGNEVEILLGTENPFGERCGTLLVKMQYGRRTNGVLGLLGPMRMDYERNLAIMRRVISLFQ